MSTVETLPSKQKHLIGVGAAIAAGCQPCTSSYVAAARAEGACERGVRFAIEQGLEGRECAITAISSFATDAFPHPELDADFRTERALLGALIGVAAAIATNAASSLKSRIDAARTLGATDSHLRIAVSIAQTTKRGAEGAMATALSTEFGDASDAAPAPCCSDSPADASTGTANGQSFGSATGPCACGAKTVATKVATRL